MKNKNKLKINDEIDDNIAENFIEELIFSILH